MWCFVVMVCALTALVGCEPKESGGDSDSATASGDGGDGGDGGGPLDCSTSTAAPAGPACVTATIGCGDVIDASTEGGSTDIDSEVYESAFCFIPYNDHDGPERVYAFTFDTEPTYATITLEADCGDLSIAALRWSDEASCPSGDDHGIANCEGTTDSDGATLTLYTDGSDPDRYLISVDGPSDAERAFRLSVTCEAGR